MRIRCSKGLRISTFHGHFFIRSSDLLALPQARSRCSFQKDKK
jgi:protein transport protein SEC24